MSQSARDAYWDNAAQETYLANYGEVPFGDIKKIDEKIIPDHSLLMCGFP
ncbi:MAG TPA: DNA cytosine methyltransferase, partial [Candidatus Hydrogenedentes bacterium]|nr:DNA cytosine methyltransferase [Candidatus Hydrogenedentota bacterium]